MGEENQDDDEQVTAEAAAERDADAGFAVRLRILREETEPEPVRKPGWARFMEWYVRRRRPRALIAQVDQNIDVRVVKTKGAKSPTGTYLPEGRGLYRLDRWLPPGQYYLYDQGDPEPWKPNGRKPKGLNALDVEYMYARWTLKAAGAGLSEPRSRINNRLLLVAGSVAFLLLVLGGYYGWRYGGWFAWAVAAMGGIL